MPEERRVIASAFMTFMDLNDSTISETPPADPEIGNLWTQFDPNTGKYIWKRWNGTDWEPLRINLGDLDPDADEVLGDHEEKFNDIADDNKLTIGERSAVKAELTVLTGLVTADDMLTLPTLDLLDVGLVGEVYSVRKQALDAGMESSQSAYVTFGLEYINLKVYLETLDPRPWDVSFGNKDRPTPINGLVYRNKWQNYYAARERLMEAITQTQAGTISNIELRVGEAALLITPDAIAATVMEHETFQMRMDEKAAAEALSDYATREDMTLTMEEYQTQMEEKIANLDMSAYVQNTDFEQTAEGLIASIKRGGGTNLINNSIGYNGYRFWQLQNEASIVIAQSDELNRIGTGSGFMSNPGEEPSIMYQPTTLINGETYCLSGFIDKQAGLENVLIEAVANAGEGENESILESITATTISGTFDYFYVSFVATGDTFGVRLTFGADVKAIVTGLMLNVGFLPFTWSTATGELYNVNMSLDLDGISVSQIEDGVTTGRTKMTPTKFAGYHDVNGDGIIDESIGSPDEVFRMDKDEFVMKKANVKNEVTMGTIKMIKVNQGGYNGWAFIPNEG